jgi:hypothetical protein
MTRSGLIRDTDGCSACCGNHAERVRMGLQRMHQPRSHLQGDCAMLVRFRLDYRNCSLTPRNPFQERSQPSELNVSTVLQRIGKRSRWSSRDGGPRGIRTNKNTRRAQNRESMSRALERIRQPPAEPETCRQTPEVGAVCIEVHVRIRARARGDPRRHCDQLAGKNPPSH